MVLVPTMGALHRGHERLIQRGRTLAGRDGLLVVSCFVNPTQFGPAEDYRTYPRPAREDQHLCRRNGTDIFFMPPAEDMYHPDHSIAIEETSLSYGMCGASRPGHFRGVCTVVAKLFLIVSPDIAVFGQKDWQQLAVIRRMVRDLDFPVRLVGVQTVREPDGLALSSRNAYLSPEERAHAPLLRQVIMGVARRLRKGSPTSAGELAAHARALLERDGKFRVDYFEIADAETLQPVNPPAGRLVVAAAVFLGRTRLIDNAVVDIPKMV